MLSPRLGLLVISRTIRPRALIVIFGQLGSLVAQRTQFLGPLTSPRLTSDSSSVAIAVLDFPIITLQATSGRTPSVIIPALHASAKLKTITEREARFGMLSPKKKQNQANFQLLTPLLIHTDSL